MAQDLLSTFTEGTFTFEGETKTVYRKGTGPAVVVMSEIPGITPRVLEFADMVVERGMSVVLPSLFGTDGKEPTNGYSLRSLAKACVSREFTVFAAGASSPVMGWLKALASHEHAEHGGPGVGVVGMCLTGGFGLAMLADDSVIAPVLSQPSLPAAVLKRNRSDLGISAAERQRIVERAASGVCVLGLRFTHDPAVPDERFAALRELLGDNFIGVELDSSPENEHGHPKGAHSVLTEHLNDAPGSPTRLALDQVLGFLAERLGA